MQFHHASNSKGFLVNDYHNNRKIRGEKNCTGWSPISLYWHHGFFFIHLSVEFCMRASVAITTECCVWVIHHTSTAKQYCGGLILKYSELNGNVVKSQFFGGCMRMFVHYVGNIIYTYNNIHTTRVILDATCIWALLSVPWCSLYATNTMVCIQILCLAFCY